MMTTAPQGDQLKPHEPYATAVMTALGDLHTPSESWTAYDSDDGEVMLMEIVITLDADRAKAAGYPNGLVLLWGQREGWRWAYETEPGRNSAPVPLVLAPVARPEDVAAAAARLLDGTGGLPLAGEQHEPPDAVLPSALQAALDELENVTDEEDAEAMEGVIRALAAYTRAFDLYSVLAVTHRLPAEAEPYRAIMEYVSGQSLPGPLHASFVRDECAAWILNQHPALKALTMPAFQAEDYAAMDQWVDDHRGTVGQSLLLSPLPAAPEKPFMENLLDSGTVPPEKVYVINPDDV